MMKRAVQFGILLLVLAFVVAAGRLAVKPERPQPFYLGKPVSYWLTDRLTFSPSVQDRPPAESAFRCMGSNAVPYLMATLGKTDGPFKQMYLLCYPKLPVRLRKQLPRPVSADAVGSRAIIALTLIGPTAKPAIPSLLDVLAKDPNGTRRANAVACLDAIDNGDYQKEVVAAWLRARSDPDPMVASRAAGVLERRFPLGVFSFDDLVRESAGVYEKVHHK